MGLSFFGSLFGAMPENLVGRTGTQQVSDRRQSGRKDCVIVACRRMFLHLLQRPSVSVRSDCSYFEPYPLPTGYRRLIYKITRTAVD